MTRAPSSDLLTQYVTLLREFGLPREEIRALHAEEGEETDVPIRKLVAQRAPAESPEVLFTSLVETLTQSRRGVNATASYWNYAPEVHLNEVFEPYGCSVTFRDTSHGTDGASLDIELEDASGSAHRMRFEYPDTPLGDDNLPALFDAVERELLAGTDLTFVLLTPVDRRWRFVLLDTERLAELRRQYGDQIEFAGRPLLRDDQPSAFASGEATEVFPSAGETEAGTGRSPRETIDTGRSVDAADLIADGDPGADPDAVLDGSPEDVLSDVSRDRQRAAADEVEASDQELKQVFGDLSDVSLEPDGGETLPATRTGESRTIELGAEAASADVDAAPTDVDAENEDPDGLDGLFEELERTAVTQDRGHAGPGEGDQSAVLLGEPSGEAPPDGRDARADAAPIGEGDGARQTSASTDGTDERDETVDAVLGAVEESLSVVEGGGEELLADVDAAESDAWAIDDPEKTAFEWISGEELAERD